MKRTDLKTYFNEQSLERARFAGELEAELIRFGKPDKKVSGSVGDRFAAPGSIPKSVLAAAIRRSWMSVEAGEDSAKESYQKALSGSLPGNLMEIIRRQASSVQRAHDHVKTLRDSAGRGVVLNRKKKRTGISRSFFLIIFTDPAAIRLPVVAFLRRSRPSCRLQQMIDDVRYNSRADQNHVRRQTNSCPRIDSWSARATAKPSRSAGGMPIAIAPNKPPGTLNGRGSSGSRKRSTTRATNSSTRLAP